MTSDVRASSEISYEPLGAHLQDPYSFFEKARQGQPIFFAPDLGAWCVTRYEDVVAIAKDPIGFSSSQAFPRPQGLDSSLDDLLDRLWNTAPPITLIDPPEHRPVRAIMNAGFTPSALRPFEPAVRDIIAEALDGVQGRAEFDIVSDFSAKVPVRAVLTVLGIPVELADQCLEWTDQLNTVIVGYRSVDTETLKAAAAGHEGFWRLAHEIIADRRVNHRGDVISYLAHGEFNGRRLNDQQIAGHVVTMIGAGYETTANAITNTVHALLSTEGMWQQLVDGRLDPAAVGEEGLRLQPSVTGTFRLVEKDAEIGGVNIPAGSLVMLLWGSANRDEQQYGEPNQFDPQRVRKSPDVTFGSGIHYCIGAPLARMELSMALQMLAQRYPNLRLAPGWEPRYRSMLQFRGLESLRVCS